MPVEFTWSARKPPLGLNAPLPVEVAAGSRTMASLPVARLSTWISASRCARGRPGDLGRGRRDHAVERAAGRRGGRIPQLVGPRSRLRADRCEQQAAVGCLADHVPGRKLDRRPKQDAGEADFPRRRGGGGVSGVQRVRASATGRWRVAAGATRFAMPTRVADAGAVGEEPYGHRQSGAIVAGRVPVIANGARRRN